MSLISIFNIVKSCEFNINNYNTNFFKQNRIYIYKKNFNPDILHKWSYIYPSGHIVTHEVK